MASSPEHCGPPIEGRPPSAPPPTPPPETPSKVVNFYEIKSALLLVCVELGRILGIILAFQNIMNVRMNIMNVEDYEC